MDVKNLFIIKLWAGILESWGSYNFLVYKKIDSFWHCIFEPLNFDSLNVCATFEVLKTVIK